MDGSLFALLLSNVEADQLSFLPILGSFLSISLLQLAVTMSNVVVVSTGKHVSATEGIGAVALLDAINPFSLITE